MESFYRKQRVRLNILMDGNEPAGGAWNFDKENRLPPPKKYEGPAYLEHPRDQIDLDVAKELGHTPTTTWATRAGFSTTQERTAEPGSMHSGASASRRAHPESLFATEIPSRPTTFDHKHSPTGRPPL